MVRALLFSFLVVLVCMPFSASAQGVDVGAPLPGTVSAKDQNGKSQDFDSLKGEKGLMLVFIRSVEWCPYCQRQVIELGENAAKFTELGYPPVAVSYDTVEKLAAFQAKFKPGLTLLADPRSEIIKQFDLFNNNYAKGTMAYGTPYPGVYIISADKIIKAKFFKEGVQDRPTIDELVEGIKALNPPPAPVAMDPAEEFPQEETAPVAPPAETPLSPAAEMPALDEMPADQGAAPLENPASVPVPLNEGAAVSPALPEDDDLSVPPPTEIRNENEDSSMESGEEASPGF